MNYALAYDIGGTKIAAALVDQNGNIAKVIHRHTNTTEGPEIFIRDIIDAGKEALSTHTPLCVGISSAGPLDPLNGHLINPTNMKTSGRMWGFVDLVSPIKNAFQVSTILENDAAAAVIGEQWMGRYTNCQNLLIMTLGTGVGIGAIVSGQLQRCRNGFHPEVSHIALKYDDTDAPCGCGNFGCIEAYLSGLNFPQYASKKFGTPKVSGKEFVELAKSGDSKTLKAFDTYSELMARAIHSLALVYSPEHVIFSGSFSSSFSFFEEKTKSRLISLLKTRREGIDFLPQLSVSTIADTAGLLGAAKMAFHSPNRL